jgi:7-carboxy-7-deazaguanine synthase
MLEITEIFSSLQGEGPYMGQPAVFIRLAGCIEPYCPWCDSSHAFGPGRRVSPTAVLHELASCPEKLVVITGGEPFRQWRTGLAELVALLHQNGRRVQYETSGRAGIPANHQGFVVCSPKPLHQPQLHNEDIARIDAFKFVIDDNIEPIRNFVEMNHIPAGKVWLMPLGASRDEQLAGMALLWKDCVRLRYNLSPRLHILAFDQRQGV